MSSPPSAPSAYATLRKMLLGYQCSQILHTAIDLGIPKLFQSKQREAGEIAVAIGTDLAVTAKLLRALAGIGVLNHLGAEKYELGHLGRGLLDTETEELVPALASFNELYRCWAALPEMVKTGKSAFEIAYGTSFWDYLKSHQEVRERASTLVTVTLQAKLQELLSAFDFSRFGRVVDVGGAHGALLRAILTKYPHLSGALFDLPEVIEDVRRCGAVSDLGRRCDLVAGDFLSDLPRDGDVYILSRVLHDWDDSRAVKILSNCHRAMERGRTLLLIEKMPGGDDLSVERVMADLKMLVLFGSCERTQEDYFALLARAGFHPQQVAATDTGLSIIEAVRT